MRLVLLQCLLLAAPLVDANHYATFYNSTDALLALPCRPRQAFTFLTFENASLVTSNLGNEGGRCVDTCYLKSGCSYPSCYTDGTCVHWYDLCLEPPDPSKPVVLFKNLGEQYNEARQIGYKFDVIWLKISNETKYRGWNTKNNGVKRQ